MKSKELNEAKDAKEAKVEYRVVSNEILSTEWEVTNSNEPNKYLKFPAFGPCMLLDGDKNPVGKIASEKFWTTKKTIQLNTSSSQLSVIWQPKASKFLLSGQTDIKGFEEINWKWKIKGWNSKFVLKPQQEDDERIIAEFRRSSWKIKEVGVLYVFEDLPRDINLLVIYSICFCINYIKEEELVANAVCI